MFPSNGLREYLTKIISININRPNRKPVNNAFADFHSQRRWQFS